MLFTSDHEDARRALQKFIAAEINPFVDEWEKAEQFPSHELFKKLGELGFLGLNKPIEFGGQGLDYSYALMMAEELGAIRCGGDFWPPRYQATRSPASACRNRAPAPTSPRSRPRRVPTATTTSSMAARCGSPTGCRPTGSVCSPIPATAPRIATSR